MKDKLIEVRDAWDVIMNYSTVNGRGYLIWRPCSRLVLVVGKDKERQCAELRVLQGRVELITCCLKVLI